MTRAEQLLNEHGLRRAVKELTRAYKRRLLLPGQSLELKGLKVAILEECQERLLWAHKQLTAD